MEIQLSAVDEMIAMRFSHHDYFEMHASDTTDYRAMLTREEHRADGRAPGESTRRPGQWVNMVESLRAE